MLCSHVDCHKVYIAVIPPLSMIEADLQAHLRRLRRSRERIKALWAWRQVKQREAVSHRISAFRLPDSTADELRNEYALGVALAVGLRAILNDHSVPIPETMREDLSRQLAEIEQDMETLAPHRRLGGLGW